MKAKNRLWAIVTASLFILASSNGPVTAQMSGAPETANVAPRGFALNPQIKARVADAFGRLPLSFEANQGQTDSRVKFVARGRGYTLFLTSGEAVLALNTAQRSRQTNPAPHEAVVRMTLLGANPTPVVSGIEQLPGRSNYFIGNDPAKWSTDVPNYARVRYQDIYPGVDLIYYGNQAQLEYDFRVAPGTDPKSIIWKVESSLTPCGKKHLRDAPLKVDHNGDLLVGVNGEEIRFQKPVAYQDMTVNSPQSRSSGTKIHRRPLRFGIEKSGRNSIVGLRRCAAFSHRPGDLVLELPGRQFQRSAIRNCCGRFRQCLRDWLHPVG